MKATEIVAEVTKQRKFVQNNENAHRLLKAPVRTSLAFGSAFCEWAERPSERKDARKTLFVTFANF